MVERAHEPLKNQTYTHSIVDAKELRQSMALKNIVYRVAYYSHAWVFHKLDYLGLEGIINLLGEEYRYLVLILLNTIQSNVKWQGN